jgi:CBS-domain-containing membrane protein
MIRKDTERRWLIIGTLVSIVIGLLLGFVTKKPLVAIAVGVILAIVIQRLSGVSE